jgi:hypothetical protein
MLIVLFWLIIIELGDFYGSLGPFNTEPLDLGNGVELEFGEAVKIAHVVFFVRRCCCEFTFICMGR